jgi:hypothetical protein
MAKANRKSSKKNAAQAVVAAFKPDMKHVKALAHTVMEQVKHAHKGVRDIIVTWKGERPETLEALKDQIKAECKVWLKAEGRNINPQSVYNYQSDLIAAANGYMAYAGMSDKKRKAFDKKHGEASGYHALIKFLRDTKRGKSNTPDVPSAAKKIKSGWKNHAKEQAKKAKDLLRYAPTEFLLQVQDFVADLITARKKGGEEGANVRKLLKRAA